MGPYYFLIAFSMMLSLFRFKKENKILNERFPLTAFFVILLVMLSLRGIGCGTDLINYSKKFDAAQPISVRSLFNFSIVEPGFLFLTSLSKTINNDFQFLLILCAIISILPIMLLYLKETNHNVLTIALFIGIAPFTMFFSGLRQGIAIGLGAVCYSFCKKDKIIPFLLIAFLAFLFHRSALALLVMYPLTHVKITKKWIIPVIGLFAICIRYNKIIFGFLLSMNEKYESIYIISETGAYTFLILLLILTVYSFIILKEDAVEVLRLRNLLLLALFIQTFAPINSIAMRINYYYLIFIPILIPQIIDNCKIRYRQVAKLSIPVFVVFFVFWFFKEAYMGKDILNVFPYVPFWE